MCKEFVACSRWKVISANFRNYVAEFCCQPRLSHWAWIYFLTGDNNEKHSIKYMKPEVLKYWTSASEGQWSLRGKQMRWTL